jgi:hypothetical protein
MLSIGPEVCPSGCRLSNRDQAGRVDDDIKETVVVKGADMGYVHVVDGRAIEVAVFAEEMIACGMMSLLETLPVVRPPVLVREMVQMGSDDGCIPERNGQNGQ